jgi:hypothetical protein
LRCGGRETLVLAVAAEVVVVDVEDGFAVEVACRTSSDPSSWTLLSVLSSTPDEAFESESYEGRRTSGRCSR